MAPRASVNPDEPHDDARWRTAGERIQNLLDASAAGGTAAQRRAEQLVGEVTDLYGAGLDRMLRLALGTHPDLADRFAADDLVASLLLVHGLHPHPVHRRIAEALDRVRPYLGSHGGDIHLIDVAGDTVRLQFAGSCKSCPSSAVTLELAVEDAIRAAAPEVSAIEVVQEQDPGSGVIPAEALLTRLRSNGYRPTAWQPVPELADLTPGEVGGFLVAGTTVLACRVGGEIVAYRDHCPACSAGLAGARLNDGVLHCRRCGTGYNVAHAGSGIDTTAHLEPIPVLDRDGVLSMALGLAAEAVPS